MQLEVLFYSYLFSTWNQWKGNKLNEKVLSSVSGQRWRPNRRCFNLLRRASHLFSLLLSLFCPRFFIHDFICTFTLLLHLTFSPSQSSDTVINEPKAGQNAELLNKERVNYRTFLQRRELELILAELGTWATLAGVEAVENNKRVE